MLLDSSPLAGETLFEDITGLCSETSGERDLETKIFVDSLIGLRSIGF